MEEKNSSYNLVNAFDKIVRDSVHTLMEEMDMCKCEKCYMDACALVFNKGYTHFVTTREGELLTKLPEMSHDYHVDMTVAIMESLKLVAKDPKH